MPEPDELPSTPQPNNPLHGVRLIDVLEFLQKKYGWKKLGEKIPIRCFTHDPSINSSLKFLRKTDWARNKVEALYIRAMELDQAKESRNVRPNSGNPT